MPLNLLYNYFFTEPFDLNDLPLYALSHIEPFNLFHEFGRSIKLGRGTVVLASEYIQKALSEQANRRQAPRVSHGWEVFPGVTFDVVRLNLSELGIPGILAASNVDLIFRGAMTETRFLRHEVPPRQYEVVTDILHVAEGDREFLVCQDLLALGMLVDMDVKD